MGTDASSRPVLPTDRQQRAQPCVEPGDGHAAVGACFRIPSHVAVALTVITEAINQPCHHTLINVPFSTCPSVLWGLPAPLIVRKDQHLMCDL